MLKRKLPLLQQ